MAKYKVEHDGRSWAVFKQERLPGPTPFMTWKLLNCFNTRKDAVAWVESVTGSEYEIDVRAKNCRKG